MYVDRKSLCHLAETEPVSFKCIVDEAKRPPSHIWSVTGTAGRMSVFRTVRPQSMEWAAALYLLYGAHEQFFLNFLHCCQGAKPIQVLNVSLPHSCWEIASALDVISTAESGSELKSSRASSLCPWSLTFSNSGICQVVESSPESILEKQPAPEKS